MSENIDLNKARTRLNVYKRDTTDGYLLSDVRVAASYE
jgi:hypothetical protein